MRQSNVSEEGLSMVVGLAITLENGGVNIQGNYSLTIGGYF